MKEIKEKLENHYYKYLGSVEVEGKVLKKGITTGTVATAVSYSAALNILKKIKREQVDIKIPKGDIIPVLIEKTESIDNLSSISYGYKYAGDDIDVTNLALISAKVIVNDSNKIKIKADKGIGIFTRDVLENKKGDYAINKKPRESIIENLNNLKEEIISDKEQVMKVAKNLNTTEEFVKNLGFEVILSVKDGEEIAKKTFNSRLGIIGGISILGTTGIVMPMSEDALKETIKKEIASKPYKTLALTFGNIGEKALIKENIPKEKICICSNFIGYSIRQVAEFQVKNLLIAGHIGKMVKIAGGIFNTHSHVADARVEILIANLALMKAPYILLEKVSNTLTAEESAKIIKEYGYEEVFNILAEKAAKKSIKHSYDKVNVEVIIFDISGNILGKTKNALSLNWNI